MAAEPAGEALPLEIVYEDPHLLVIDKPAGLVVHPAAGHAGGTLVNALIAHCGDELSGIGGVKRPGIVHRLDKDTSGLLVVAKTDAAHRGLAEQFAAHGADGRLARTYEAFVWGVPLRKHGSHRRKPGAEHVQPDTHGGGARYASAVTRLRTMRSSSPSTELAAIPSQRVVRLALETGRTHQIRVHLAHLGHPVMGDPPTGRASRPASGRCHRKLLTR